MRTGHLTALLIVLVVLGLIAWLLYRQPIQPTSSVPSPTPTRTICTMDAKMCPDGSYVGRTGPNCEFAMCPITDQAKFPSGIFAVGFGQRAGGGTLIIIPREILEDSRCPSDVQCIQAGTVRIKADVVYKGATTTQTIKLDTPLSFGASSATMNQVLPAPISTKKILPAEYRFTFTFVP